MIRPSILAASLLLCLAATGETAALPLNGGKVIREPEEARPISGRLGDPDALLIREGALEWEIALPPENGFAEFWIKPENWDAWSQGESVISRFTIGTTEYTLSKAAARSELVLSDAEGVLQVYPIYGWDEEEWVKAIPKKRILQRSIGWHHIHFQLTPEKLRLFVDGFPARTVSDRSPKGGICKLALEGSPGTRFAVPVVSAAAATDVRSRFLTLFLSQPELKTSVLAVPYLAAKPEIDGLFHEAEWSLAARMTGFGTIRKNQLVKEAVTGYIGYDDQAVYVAVVTPAPTQDGVPADDEAYDLLLGPPFVSGEDPRRLLQFIGDISGGQQLLQVLPSRIENLPGKWLWKTSRRSSQWVAEASIRFADLGLPRPLPGERWYLNLINRKANAAWLSPKVERYETLEDVATIRFEREAPAIRVGQWKITGGTLAVPITIVSGSFQGDLQAGIRLFSEKDILPLGEKEKTVRIRAGASTTVHLSIPLEALEEGWVAVSLKHGGEDLYQHNVRFPEVVGRPSNQEVPQ
ncbi:MAG TPA: hypothetical protein VNQ90_11520 [Chthoniobacteraceae bacterium]|nr:hypothetical protein [Chthoniobacteraceae bacterium]